MRFTWTLIAVLLLSGLLAGCITEPTDDEDNQDDTDTEPQYRTVSSSETYTGTVPVGHPGQMDEVNGGCTELVAGEEDVDYVLVPFDVEVAPSDSDLVLTSEGEEVGGAYTFPDLELRLLGPDGSFLDDCEGVTGNAQEEISLRLTEAGTYQGVVMGYAGAAVDFELKVTLSHRVLVEETEQESEDEDAGEAGGSA